MPRLTSIYTRKGDDGTTALGGGQRISKNDLRVQAYGTLDELNSTIGVALAFGLDEKLAAMLSDIQNDLFNAGSDLCFLEEDKANFALPQIEPRHIETLENWIDELGDIVGPLQNFILPGGTPGAAHLHVARTVCRRAERELISLSQREPIGKHIAAYVNRLSDALFVMARYENFAKNQPETLWDSRK